MSVNDDIVKWLKLNFKNREEVRYKLLSNLSDIINEYEIAFPKKTISWNKQKCIENAKKFNNKSSWAKSKNTSYDYARKHDLLDECTLHMKVLVGFWTKEACIIEAKKYMSRREWELKSSGSYNKATKNKWSECFKHMKPSVTGKKKIKCSNGYTYESITKAAKKLNIHVASIHHVLKDKQKLVKGYTFEYVD